MTWAEKLAHDFEYIADRSLRLYFEIVVETAWLVLSRPFRPPGLGICAASAASSAATGGPSTRGAGRDERHAAHRGPDSGGEVIDREAGLAARRLAIIDLEGGDQPIASEDGRVVVVQNGEIYNHAGLRAELERAGHASAPASDTEVLVHLYEEYGPRFAVRLRGMFAFALWDGGRRRLVLARDRLGIKPLYYRDGPGRLVFASELKALLAVAGGLARPRPGALEPFSRFNAIHGPRRSSSRSASSRPATCSFARRGVAARALWAGPASGASGASSRGRRRRGVS